MFKFFEQSTWGISSNKDMKNGITFIAQVEGLNENMTFPEFFRWMLQRVKENADVLRIQKEESENIINGLKDQLELANEQITSLMAKVENTADPEALSRALSKVTILESELETMKPAYEAAQNEVEQFRVQRTSGNLVPPVTPTSILVESSKANIRIVNDWCEKKGKTPGKILIDDMFITMLLDGVQDMSLPRITNEKYKAICAELNTED